MSAATWRSSVYLFLKYEECNNTTMAQCTAVVGIGFADEVTLFGADAAGEGRVIRVGGPNWSTWLATARLFRYQHPAVGNFTARKEARRYTVAWYAYRKVRGKQLTAYVGKDADLTAERLYAVAQRLTAKATQLTTPPMP